MTNIEYIRSLSEREIQALWDVAAGGYMEVTDEQCNLCRYGGCAACASAAESGSGEKVIEECDKAMWRWLHDEVHALKEAVQEESRGMKALTEKGSGEK